MQNYTVLSQAPSFQLATIVTFRYHGYSQSCVKYKVLGSQFCCHVNLVANALKYFFVDFSCLIPRTKARTFRPHSFVCWVGVLCEKSQNKKTKNTKLRATIKTLQQSKASQSVLFLIWSSRCYFGLWFELKVKKKLKSFKKLKLAF